MPYPISLDLQQKNAQTLKQLQRLIMSPQMQQAIHLLQVPIMELSALIDAELEQNPLLEISEENSGDEEKNQDEIAEENPELDSVPERELSFDERDLDVLRRLEEDFRYTEEHEKSYQKTRADEKLDTFLESSICSDDTLFDYLKRQAIETFQNEKLLAIADVIIGSLNEHGFLESPLEELALLNEFSLSDVKFVLKKIQGFDPAGIAAQDLQDCLRMQLIEQGKRDTLAFNIVDHYYEDLLHNRIASIQKSLSCTQEEIKEAIEKDIAKLQLHPGSRFSKEIIQTIVPDVILHLDGERLTVEVNEDELPPLRLNPTYMKMMEDETVPTETKDFVKHKVLSAKWLLRNIYQRGQTLEKIAYLLAKRQESFFLHAEGKLVPMTMKYVAQEVGLHESTIARAVSNKYIYSPRGLHPLRFFFTTAYIDQQGNDVSAKTVKDLLQDLIRSENKKAPLSDEVLSQEIEKRGIHCARRTVAKYRAELKIGNAQQRKKIL
jgi:RNA polymerase sigma-54 factor